MIKCLNILTKSPNFYKGFSTQNYFLYMEENWKKYLDQVTHYGALF